MNPVVATCFIVLTAALALLLVWQRSTVSVSAAELLERAKTSDRDTFLADGPGVVYQKVRIRTAHAIFDRDLYRDRERRRRPKAEAVAAELTPIKARLALASVNWDEPLSASSYKEWHDRQQSETDEVMRSGKNLLTLTTKTPGGAVEQESLTVREYDFHPVKRTVELPDIGTVEIAELNYAVLSWDAVNSALLFEPEPGSAPSVASAAAPKMPVTALPSFAALDEAELRARLVLNRVKADTGEQIAVTQSQTAVQVTGMVETDQRKRQLEAELRSLPLVTTSLQSIEEFARQPTASGLDFSSIKEYRSIAQGSPLDAYLAQRSVPREEAAKLSEGLFDAAFTIQKESLALSSLDARFSPQERRRLDQPGLALLDELFGKHLDSLGTAIASEQGLLSEYAVAVAPADSPGSDASGSGRSTLDDLGEAATENKKLCNELLTGTGVDAVAKRSAEAILSDLTGSVSRLRAITATLNRTLRGTTDKAHSHSQ